MLVWFDSHRERIRLFRNTWIIFKSRCSHQIQIENWSDHLKLDCLDMALLWLRTATQFTYTGITVNMFERMFCANFDNDWKFGESNQQNEYCILQKLFSLKNFLACRLLKGRKGNYSSEWCTLWIQL